MPYPDMLPEPDNAEPGQHTLAVTVGLFVDVDSGQQNIGNTIYMTGYRKNGELHFDYPHLLKLELEHVSYNRGETDVDPHEGGGHVVRW